MTEPVLLTPREAAAAPRRPPEISTLPTPVPRLPGAACVLPLDQ